ncbi:MAG: hypothetical protein Ta2E_01660 [Mycoplasmoidaceae bacterium]|nr:MAG: hypothetical protein Ta2E_01660 [Mycoplasmoidaceae bacterium]
MKLIINNNAYDNIFHENDDDSKFIYSLYPGMISGFTSLRYKIINVLTTFYRKIGGATLSNDNDKCRGNMVILFLVKICYLELWK